MYVSYRSTGVTLFSFDLRIKIQNRWVKLLSRGLDPPLPPDVRVLVALPTRSSRLTLYDCCSRPFRY